jgi:hypothetical protein
VLLWALALRALVSFGLDEWLGETAQRLLERRGAAPPNPEPIEDA